MKALIKESSTSQSRRGNLEDYLYSQIKVGHLRPGDKISTSKLAEEWEVSEGTVNQLLHVLAAKGLLVRKPRAGTFVCENAAENTQPSQANDSIALVLPDLKQPEFSYVFQCMQQAAIESPFTVNAYGTDDSVEQYAQVIDAQIDSRAAAIVLIPPLSGTLPVELLIRLYESKIPVMTCFRSIEGFNWPVVRVDQIHNTQIATRHLAEIGRKNIGLVSLDVPNTYNDLLKEYTFINTLDEFGLSTRKDLRLSLSCQGKRLNGNQMWLFNAIETVERWLSEHPEIDGICCLHDRGAWAVLSTLAKVGKIVPDEIAVVGNGNMQEFFGFTNGDLTTVDCCYDKFGAMVIKQVAQMVAGEQYETNKVIEVKGKLILRHSTLGNSSGK